MSVAEQQAQPQPNLNAREKNWPAYLLVGLAGALTVAWIAVLCMGAGAVVSYLLRL
jgi:hypothetical protein